MKKISLLLILVLAFSLVPSAAWADGSPWTQREGYMQKMFGKLDFGLKNVIFGGTHLISEPLHGVNDGGFVGGLKGLGTGVVHSIEYIGGGALHAVTFPITALDIPLPDNGVHCPCHKE